MSSNSDQICIPLFQSRYDGQYAARYTLNFCLVGAVIALPQKRSSESNSALVDNTEGLSCFGIRDYLGDYCSSLPWFAMGFRSFQRGTVDVCRSKGCKVTVRQI